MKPLYNTNFPGKYGKKSTTSVINIHFGTCKPR